MNSKSFYIPTLILLLAMAGLGCQEFTAPTQEVPDVVSRNFQYLGPLPAQLSEISGMVIADTTLWAHNDSGDGPYLYQVGLRNKKLLRIVTIAGLFPVDCEEMTRDDSYFYLGDFGNNNGNRQDLTIYEIAIDSLVSAQSDKIPFQKEFRFSYQDQTRFNHGPYQHNFDCEAMIALGDTLYLFSKNHEDDSCRVYGLPKHLEGRAVARLTGAFNTEGTITAAAYTLGEKGPVLALLGYNFKGGSAFYPFLWLFTEFTGTDFFSGKQQRISLPPIAQTEGLTFLTPTQLLISSEAESFSFGKLFQFNIEDWLE